MLTNKELQMIVDDKGMIDSKLSRLVNKSHMLNDVIITMLVMIILIIYFVPGGKDVIDFDKHPVISSMYLLNLPIVIIIFNITRILMIYTKARNRFKYSLISNKTLSLLELRKIYTTSIILKELIIGYLAIYLSILLHYII